MCSFGVGRVEINRRHGDRNRVTDLLAYAVEAREREWK